MPDQWEEDRKVIAAATPGPWMVKSVGHGLNRLQPVAIVLSDSDSIDWTEADYNFVVKASERWGAALSALADKDATIAELRMEMGNQVKRIAELEAKLKEELP